MIQLLELCRLSSSLVGAAMHHGHGGGSGWAVLGGVQNF